MLLRFEATLNGVAFSNIDEKLILRDIEEMRPRETQNESPRATYPGTRVSSRVRRALSVRLIFCVREYDITKRADVLDKVAKWAANGGWLTINSRPGQRLYVRPDEMPSMGSSLKWTDDMYMTLTAYENPFWEDATATTITANGYLKPEGTYPMAYVSCDITNTAQAALTTLTINCGSTKIRLEGLYLTNGQTVSIGYTDDGILQITANGVSALAKRTPDSSDDLMIRSGVSTWVSVTANTTVSRVFSTRGRYW